MTTIEFVTKCLHKAKVTLEIQQQRKASPEALENLEEKVALYEEILRELKEAKLVRKYIYENELVWDLFAFGRKEGFFK